MASPIPVETEAARQRKSLLAQLDALCVSKPGGRFAGTSYSNLTSSPHGSRVPSRSFALSHGSASPNTRRLPPVFQEQRQHAVAIHHTCAGLHDTLHLLDSAFGGGVTWSTLAAFISGVHGAGHRPRSADAFSLSSSSAFSLASARGRRSRAGLSGFTVCTSAGLLETRRPEDIARVRAAAADEGHEDEQSVSDYAAEPNVPHFSQGDVLRDDLGAMEASLKKIVDGFGQMMAIECRDSGNPWWQSAMLTRDMKALAIRVNYHARHALQWNYRARERFLMNAVNGNEHSEKVRVDLIYLREQQALFSKRVDACVQAQEDAAREIETLQDTLQEAKAKRAEMQRTLVDRAHERGLMPHTISDSTRAELLLLLEHVSWPPVLAPDVERVAAWIREKPMFADV